MQLGQAPDEYAPDEMFSLYKNRAKTTTLLAKLGFESIHAYEEVSAHVSCLACSLFFRSDLTLSVHSSS